MPKVVETFTLLKRGDTIRLAAPQYKKCVSNCFGNYDKNGYHFNDSRFGLKNFKQIHFRFKRDLDEPNLDIVHSLPNRRVVKKLIRIQPIYNQTIDLNHSNKHEVNYFHPNNYSKLNIPRSENSLSSSSSEEDYSTSSTASRKHYRKRVVIKKRRKKRPKITPSSTKLNRRKVVKTKKRLLTNTTSATMTTAIFTSPNYILPTAINTSLITETLLPSIAQESSIVDVLDVTQSKTMTTSTELQSSTFPLDEDEEEEEHEERVEREEDKDDEEEDEIQEEEEEEEEIEEEEEDVTEEAAEEDVGITEPSSVAVKNVPDYEPFFPELSESLDAPVLLLKTTVIASIEYETKTVLQSRLRTYTFVVTRANENEQIVTSTTEVKPQTKTLTVTESRTRFTTLTLLDLGVTETLPFVPFTIDSSSRDTTSHYTNTPEYDGRTFEEARYNLATRIMSNGVEVIVASDKSTLPGEPDVKRVLPSSIYKPITLKPSTLTDHMMMMLPQDASNAESLSSSLYPNQFVTKTCLTTFTYLTTFLENGTTTISSHEQVVSNIATEERNSAKIIPTPSVGITLTQHPNLAVGTFLTTYTYLNTILDGEQPLVVTSKHTVTNTITAPDDYLSLLQPPRKASAVKDTNTYYSTLSLEKTLYEGKQSKIISTNEVVTQVVITESIPPKATSVMTSYVALDFEENAHNSLNGYTTTDVVKTYYVTYTYFNTLLENGHTVVKTNVSTSSDIVTEKLFLQPKRTHSQSVINTSPIVNDKKKQKVDVLPENFQIQATKTYVTTFTYFTTLLQENSGNKTSTIISSRTREVENIVTETINPSLLDSKYLSSLKLELEEGGSTAVKLITLNNGQKLEVTAFKKDQIEPTKVLPIEKTQMVETKVNPPLIESSNPNVITGSTIIFFDEEDQIDSTSKKPTPLLASKPVKLTKTSSNNGLGSLLSSEIVKKSQVVSTHKQISKSQTKRHVNKQTRLSIVSSKTSTSRPATVNSGLNLGRNKTNVAAAEPLKKKTVTKVTKPAAEIPDLLGLGSINVNTLHALKPVINAMAGLITTNLKGNKRNDTLTTTPNPKYDSTIEESAKVTVKIPPAHDIQNRSPIYIPIGDQEDGLEIAESQNIATIHINEWEEDTPKPYKDQVVIGKPTHESPLLNGGIPISPGQVITANSDVIVGKPGRIGPRIPSIPLNKNHQDDVPIDMRPPPVHLKSWPKRHNDKFTDHIPNASNIKENPDFGGSQNDYYGPPPPVPPKVPLRPLNFVRGEKHKVVDRKRIPIPRPNQELNHIPVNVQNAVPPENLALPQVIIPQVVPVQIPLEAPTLILTKPAHVFDIQPSVLNQPIVLPEVIERSTGQPLLVNLQPSQIAFVNIPHNRTTALIYGGSIEPHKNGQYFDDPSPYPEPEFSGIEHFSNGVPQYASVYDDSQNHNQKHVGGVIKVGTDVINNNPLNLPPSIPSQIRPSRPINQIPNNVIPQHELNIRAPPISFGMVHHGNDFNAHIINHGNIKFSPPPASYEVVPNIDYQNVIQGVITHQSPNTIPFQYQDQGPIRQHHLNGIISDGSIRNTPINQIENVRLPSTDETNPIQRPNIYEPSVNQLDQRFPNAEMVRPFQRPDMSQSHLHHQFKKHRKPNPNLSSGLTEYLTPPQLNKFSHKRPEIPIQLSPAYSIDLSPPPPPSPPTILHHPHQPHPHIPINVESESNVVIQHPHSIPQIPINFEADLNTGSISNVDTPPQSVLPSKKPQMIPLSPTNYDNSIPIGSASVKQESLDEDMVDHKEDDLANEAGEVIQESNPRPLRPGQIPIEVLRANLTTTERPTSTLNVKHFTDAHNVNFGIQVAGHDNEVSNYHRPVIQDPRPFATNSNVKPKPTNHYEPLFFGHSGTEDSRPFVRPQNHQSNQVNVKDHSIYGQTTSTKQPQHYLEGMENVNISFGQKIPNLSNPQYPADVGNAFVSKIKNHRNNFYTTSKPLFSKIPIDSYGASTTLTPYQNVYDQVTAGSVEVIPVGTNNGYRRPYITSMPVNPPDITHRPLVNVYAHPNNYGSQTEKPFDSSLAKRPIHSSNAVNTSYGFSSNDVMSIQNVPTLGEKTSTEYDNVTPKTPQSIIDPNFVAPTGSPTNITSYELDMEVMKPPPPPQISTEMQPPNIEVHSPGAGIHRVPNLNLKRPAYDLEGQASSPSPYVPQPIEGGLPHKTQIDEQVMGLSPPPPITTHRPVLHFKPNVSTHKPIFSLEIDPPRPIENKPVHPYTFESPATTTPATRRRRPYTKRPGSRRTTQTTVPSTTVATTTPPVVTRRGSYNRRRTTSATTEVPVKEKATPSITQQHASESENKETNIAPSSPTTIQKKPLTEIPEKKPGLVEDVGYTSTTPIYKNVQNSSRPQNEEVQVMGSEMSPPNDIKPTKTETLEETSTSTLRSTTSGVPANPAHIYTTPVTLFNTSTVRYNFTTGTHHAGNEIKIVEDPITVATTAINTGIAATIKPSTTTAVLKETKMIVPTRYITHTKTSTVTITKTTVVKTLGGPPSTMTILVTKTEKSTKVDTVTEIHTLVKPTSIVETVTTTINQAPATLYPPDVSYGNTYSSYPPILPTSTLDPNLATSVTTAAPPKPEAEDDLEEFIIHDVDEPPATDHNTSVHVPSENDSIFVVMTDQKHGEVIAVPEKTEDDSYETQSRDEIPANNEVNRVLLGGILIASPPSLEVPNVASPVQQDKCNPECKASKNELCQKVEGVMRCVCRPGFARMFPDRPCKPTYTYSIKIGLERYGKAKLQFEEALADNDSPEFNQLATITHEALDRMVMQSDLRDIYHGVHVHSYEPVLNDEGVVNNFYLQLSDNTDEQRLKEIFKKYLRSNNYSLGGTELYASKDFLDNLAAEDFDECANPQFHDCSEHAHCFNLPGTYTCSCKEGFSDLSENTLYPGRICSAELIGCEKCHYHGTCYSKGDDQVICECFHWYAGENCHINLKVLLIALVTLGALLFALLLVCIILTCTRRKPQHATLASGMSFMPQRLSNPNGRRATLDRRAMIQETSSEGSQSDTNTLPYVAKKPKRQPKGALKKTAIINADVENGTSGMSFPDQKDRSLTVMIPRAKYHPAPPTSPHLNMESFNKRKSSAASSNEAKLLSYLDAGPSPSKVDVKRKYSNTPSDSYRHDKPGPRKISGGALVSAGFEVSATVGGIMGTMGTIGTTCGTEADRSENATLIQKISADLLSSTGTRSQFTTFRKSLVDTDIDDPLSNWLDITPKVTTTVSEARSYDETTIQPPTKSYRNGYDSKPSSQHQNDEANTMAERDVGSTFLLPHTHLYKPDRGSDISGFDSL